LLEEKTNELASARARLGYVVFPGLFAYGIAGTGWGHTEFSSHGFTVSAGNQFGWVAGAGLEYKLIEHVLLRAEYLHYDFAQTTFAPVDQFAAGQEQMTREIIKLQEISQYILYKSSEPPPRPAPAPARTPFRGHRRRRRCADGQIGSAGSPLIPPLRR